MAYDKIVLFDGTSTDAWVDRNGNKITWEIDKEGFLTVVSGDIISKETYGDAMIHVEFRCPYMPGETGQGRGNSGVYVHGCYEIQVLDSYGIENPSLGDCGAVYNLIKPNMNASAPAGEWQTYDILIRAPKYDDNGIITEKAILSIIHNGLPIHNSAKLENNTPGGVYNSIVANGPLLLQDHGNPVSYRNIWLIKL